MIILIKNQTTQDIALNDLSGYLIPASSSKDIAIDKPLNEIAESNHLLELISNGAVIINNGIMDLDKSTAIRYVSLQNHLNPISPDGKEVIKTESRPPGTQTSFTMVGDNLEFGDGKRLLWDFSNDDDIVPADSTSLILHNKPLPDGFKRKLMRMRFNDPVYVKEGTLYFFDVPFGCYADMSVVCPAGNYYRDRTGAVKLATNNVCVSHYVTHYFMCGTCPCGHTLLAETCQEIATPTNYETWVEITTPISDTTSKGFGCFTLYRKRTTLLPGESL